MHDEKLHKILARAGVASRRKCESLIREGRVSVDGIVVDNVASRVDPARRRIQVDGEPVRTPRSIHLLFYKPRGVVCTNREGEDKPRVVDLVKHFDARLFTIGRLDEESDGLILVTNDGEFGQTIAHPRHRIPKTYEVVVPDRVSPAAVQKIERGVWISSGKTRVSAVRICRRTAKATRIRITLNEGKNREVRRIFARLGYRVRRLTRVGIGPLRIGDLRPGRYRKLKPAEIRALTEMAASGPGGTLTE